MSPVSTIAQLTTLFTQAVFYGLYVVTLIHCLRWLVYTDDGWEQWNRINKLMLITTVLIFLLSTVNLVLLLPFQFFVDDSNVWSVAEEVLSVCGYRGWGLEQQ